MTQSDIRKQSRPLLAKIYENIFNKYHKKEIIFLKSKDGKTYKYTEIQISMEFRTWKLDFSDESRFGLKERH